MTTARFSLRFVLMATILAMALIGIALLAVSGAQFQKLIYDNKTVSVQDLVELQSQNVLKALNITIIEMGNALQTRSATRDLIQGQDLEQLATLLNGQFRQYLVSSGSTKLQRVYAFDVNYKLLAKSTEGLVLRQDDRIMCSALVDRARLRKGAERLRPVSEMCVEDGYGLLAVMVTVASFKPLGYLLLVVDPAHTLGDIEKTLGVPVAVYHPNGNGSYVSQNWAGETVQADDQHLHVTHWITSDSGARIARVEVLEHIEGFQNSLFATTRNLVLSALVIFALTLALALWLVRRALYELSAVAQGARKLAHGVYEKVPEGRFPEINSLIESFNSMSAALSGMISQLKQAQHDADRANKAKSLFLANMSHEIRTPMNAVMGYAQILARDATLSDGQRHAVSTIERSGSHLLSLINEVLDISKIEAGKMELHETDFDLVGLINDLSDMFRLRCDQAGLSWHLELPSKTNRLFLRGDQGKLRQVLINLLGNAVKFTADGSVRLSVRFVGDERYLFEVVDTGPGIREEVQKSIFTAFSQADEGHKKGGTGLGLAIAARHIEMMGGKLQLESAPGAGARFYFALLLPPAVAEPASQPALPAVIRLRAPLKALVVDDNAINRDVLAHFLRDMGFTVAQADDGDTALAALAGAAADVVFMDYKMPRLNGADATRQIRARYGDAVKVIMVSASVYEHEANVFREAGASASLRKPVSLQELGAAIAQVLGADAVGAEPAASPFAQTTPSAAVRSTAPVDLLKNISDLADYGLVTELEQKLDELKAHDTELAAALIRLAQDWKLDELARMAQQAKTA